MSKENDLNEIFQYKYNTDDLDKIIEQENKGIRMMIPGDMRVEVDLRKKELLLEAQNEMNDEELEEFLSEENTTEVIKKHKSIIQNKIEQERRNAHVDEYVTLDITDEEKAMMEELCATSYVRELPGVSYHKAESELYDSDERKQILQKVKRIGNVYYTIEDWRNAMMILLEAYDYFTDSEKVLNGMARPELITLAPNSITKIRIYVWIEGQDIDNYDFSSIGKQIN